jgi:hypothetical protein
MPVIASLSCCPGKIKFVLTAMTHDYIDDNQIAARYLMGKLDAEEEAAFEEHFVDCRECLANLELIRDFRGHLHDAASETLSQRRGWFARLAGLALWQQRAAWAAAAMVLIGVPSIILQMDLRGRFGDDAPAQEQVTDAGIPLGASIGRLTSVRGATGGEPASRVELTGAPWVALLPEHEYDPAFVRYTAALTDSAGRQIWSAADLKAAGPDTIAVLAPASSLNPGEYSLRLEGVDGQGRAQLLGLYRFLVIKK